MTPSQREAVAKGLVEVAGALTRIAAALTADDGGPPGLSRCPHIFAIGWAVAGSQCVRPVGHDGPHMPEVG